MRSYTEVYSFTTQSDLDDQDDNGIPVDNELDDDTDLMGLEFSKRIRLRFQGVLQ